LRSLLGLVDIIVYHDKTSTAHTNVHGPIMIYLISDLSCVHLLGFKRELLINLYKKKEAFIE
jgi:hypothetical protein